MLSLARALGWPFETKQLVFNPLRHLPYPLLRASLLNLNRSRSSRLAPPWPDLVIAASRGSAPAACWIRQQSGGHTRLVHLLHAQAPLDRFDLVITMPQYCLPELPNVLHNIGPLNVNPPESRKEAAQRWAPRLADLPRPWTALLVGGTSWSYVLDATTAARLGREASREANAARGSLLISTSRRTSRAATDALFAAVDCPSHCYRWQPGDSDNPYLGYLALADRFIVTADSASLLAEACATGKPVALFQWPLRPARRYSARALIQRASKRPESRIGRAYGWLVYEGLVKPLRDFEAFHRALVARGLVARLGESGSSAPRRPLDDMERAVAAVRDLMGAEGASARR